MILRHDDPLLRLVAFNANLNELPIDKPSVRIWQRGTHRNGIGGLIDFHIHEIDLARVRIDRSVRELDNHLGVAKRGEEVCLK
jgi:predicted dehydrogenase